MFKNKFPKDFNIISDIQTHYLMHYSSDKQRLYTHSANLDEDFIKQLKFNMESKYDLPLDTFETEKEIDDKVYFISNQDKIGLKFYDDILDLFNIKPSITTKSNSSISPGNKIPSPSKLKFIISQFKTKSDENILIFTRQDRIGIPNKKKAFKFSGGEDFKVVEIDDIYLFNPFPTCIFINEDIYVIDYKGFIEIFQYKEHLKKHVSDVIEMLEKSTIISNIGSYKKNFNEYRYFNAITKIDNDSSNVVKFIKSNEAEIKKITNDYDVHFDYDSSQNNFQILKEDGIKILVRLLSDRTGFSLANNFIMYPTRETINRKKPKKSLQQKNKRKINNKK